MKENKQLKIGNGREYYFRAWKRSERFKELKDTEK